MAPALDEHGVWGPDGHGLGPARETFHDVTALSWLVIGFAFLTAVSDVVTSFTGPAAQAAYTAAQAATLDPYTLITVNDAVRMMALLLLIPMWATTSAWLYQVHRNADLVAPRGGRRSATWSWLGWAVPVGSLWIPKEVVDESWRTTAAALPQESRHRRVRSTGWWWGLWVCYQLAGTLSGRLPLDDAPIPHTPTIPHIDEVLAVLVIPTLVLWVIVVRRVTAVQSELVRTGVVPYRDPRH